MAEARALRLGEVRRRDQQGGQRWSSGTFTQQGAWAHSPRFGGEVVEYLPHRRGDDPVQISHGHLGVSAEGVRSVELGMLPGSVR